MFHGSVLFVSRKLWGYEKEVSRVFCQAQLQLQLQLQLSWMLRWFYSHLIQLPSHPHPATHPWKFIATLGSILNSQLIWEYGKFQLAGWSHNVALFSWNHPPATRSTSFSNRSNVWCAVSLLLAPCAESMCGVPRARKSMVSWYPGYQPMSNLAANFGWAEGTDSHHLRINSQ